MKRAAPKDGPCPIRCRRDRLARQRRLQDRVRGVAGAYVGGGAQLVGRGAASSASNPEQTMSSRLLIAAGILLLISGCATVQKESPEAYVARLQANCTEAGFQRDTENYRLCLLIQGTNERLDAVEQQLRYVDMNTRWRPYPYWWW
jgi:hypothetical protein